MKHFWVMVLMFAGLVAAAHSESYSQVSRVEALTVGKGYARVKLADMKLKQKRDEKCQHKGFYILDTKQSPEMYDAILRAYDKDRAISFQLVGCMRDLPQISHVYLCPTKQCRGYQ